MQYRQVQMIGGKFHSAVRGLATDSRGWLYAAGDSRIQVFDPAGALQRQWTTPRPPHSVAVAGDGSVYVGQEARIDIFDASGKPVRAWTNLGILGPVTALGFVGNSVLAADAADRAIRRFDLTGRFLNHIGKNNPVNGFLIPNGAHQHGRAVDPRFL